MPRRHRPVETSSAMKVVQALWGDHPTPTRKKSSYCCNGNRKVTVTSQVRLAVGDQEILVPAGTEVVFYGDPTKLPSVPLGHSCCSFFLPEKIVTVSYGGDVRVTATPVKTRVLT